MADAEQIQEPESSLPRGRIFNNKVRLLVVGAVLALGLGYLLYAALPGSLRYNLTVSELLADNSAMSGQAVRVAGKLDPGSYTRTQGTLEHHFTLVEGEQALEALYTGPLPDLFYNEHSEIFLEGNYSGGVFNAHTAIVKCPSKYRALADSEESSDSPV